MISSNTIFIIGYFLIFLGIIIVFITMFMFLLKSIKGKTETRGGGIIFIGPFPVIFGTDIHIAKWLVIVALIIVLILLTITLIPLVTGG